jgi:hypothetical protein
MSISVMLKKYVSSVDAEEAEECPHGIWFLFEYIHAITYAITVKEIYNSFLVYSRPLKTIFL